MSVTLTRDNPQPANYCTLGRLAFGPNVLQTIELSWVPVIDAPCGHKETSCVGKGLYRLEHRYTEARGDHFLLSNPALYVWRNPADIPAGAYGRSLVLIHAANWAHELRGCIAPGKGRDVLDGEWCVKASRVALRELILWSNATVGLELEIK